MPSANNAVLHVTDLSAPSSRNGLMERSSSSALAAGERRSLCGAFAIDKLGKWRELAPELQSKEQPEFKGILPNGKPCETMLPAKTSQPLRTREARPQNRPRLREAGSLLEDMYVETKRGTKEAARLQHKLASALKL